MRGELTKVSLEDSGVVSKHSSSAALTQKYIDSLSLDLLDDECVESAKVMATVYTAIAAFENMVRQFVVKISVKYPDKVFSKQNLYESIWQEPFARDNDVINTHISNLRKKLKGEGCRIKTIWGLGYRFAK